MRTRLLVGALGVAAGLFGLWRLVDRGWDPLVQAVLWLGGGVVLHDGVVAPLTLLLVVVGLRVVPRGWRARVTLALLVLLTVTATAVPVLGRWGARPDNPTLLDRHYVAGWCAFAVLVMLVTLAAGPVARAVRRRR